MYGNSKSTFFNIYLILEFVYKLAFISFFRSCSIKHLLFVSIKKILWFDWVFFVVFWFDLFKCLSIFDNILYSTDLKVIFLLLLFFFSRGLFIIDGKGRLRQMTVNDLPVGRSVDETLRLVQAFQFTDAHGEGKGAALCFI